MATIKSYSVAKTHGTAGTNSGVYATSKGRMNAYDHPTTQGLVEGRTATLLNGSRSAVNHDVTAIKGVTAAGTTSGLTSATAVVATTTTVTGSGAGLIVKFTTTAAGVANGTHGNYTIIDGGEGYATDDTVSIDGFPGSVLSVTAA